MGVVRGGFGDREVRGSVEVRDVAVLIGGNSGAALLEALVGAEWC